MYRQSNDRYSENNQINPMSNYPPIPNIPKMHGHLEGYNPPPMPVYYDTPQPYQFAQQPPPPGTEGGYDNRFSNWREISQSKNPMVVNPNLPPINPLSHYDVRQPLHFEPYSQPKNMQPQNFPPVQNNQIQPPQINVVQRISGVIKSQLSYLHSIMLYADRKTQQQKGKKERERSRSRSRSRDRDRGARGGMRDRSREREREKHHRQWNCSKCSFLNFDFRDRCKRCNQPKPESQRGEKVESGGKNYVPGPDDWRCSKCGNINYARRLECHRCRTARNK